MDRLTPLLFASASLLLPSQAIAGDLQKVQGEARREVEEAVLVPEPYRLELKVHLGGGIDQEATAPYSLGKAGEFFAGVMWNPLNAHPAFSGGLMGTYIVSSERTGFEGGNLALGWDSDEGLAGRINVYGTVGPSFEPLQDSLNAPSIGGLLQFEFLPEGPLGFNCGGTFERHLYGGGSLTEFNPALICAVSYDLSRGMEKEEELVDGKARLKLKEDPYAYQETIYPDAEAGSVLEGEVIQLVREMKAYAARNAWGGVETNFKTLLKKKVNLSYEAYLLGAQAAQNLGDIQAYYERLQSALRMAGNDEVRKAEVEGFMNSVKSKFASVSIEVPPSKKDNVLEVDIPFGLDQRAAITWLMSELAKDGSATGFMPLIDDTGASISYTLGGQAVTGLVPLAESEVTVRITLEKSRYACYKWTSLTSHYAFRRPTDCRHESQEQRCVRGA